METMYPGMVNSPATYLDSDINESVTTIAVAELAVFPPAPNLAVIGEELDAETILYTGKSAESGEGQLLNVTRGFQGEAQSWPTDTRIARTFTAYDFDSLRTNLLEVNVLQGQTAGESLTQYNVVYRHTDSKWYKADSGYSTKIGGMVGIALSSAASQESLSIQVEGVITNLSWSLNTAKPVYIGSTGSLSATPGIYTKQLGYALSTTTAVLSGRFSENPIRVGIASSILSNNEIIVNSSAQFFAVYESEYPISSFDWDYGDSSTHGTTRAVQHIYTSAGTYDICLTLTDTQSNKKSAHYTLYVVSTYTYPIPGKQKDEIFPKTHNVELNANVNKTQEFPLTHATSSHLVKEYHDIDMVEMIGFDTLEDEIVDDTHDIDMTQGIEITENHDHEIDIVQSIEITN